MGELLGHGGFAVVHKGWYPSVGEVAVKIAKSGAGEICPLDALACLRQEVQVLKALQTHGNIIGFIAEHRGLNGELALVMEMCRGGELHQRVARLGSLPEGADAADAPRCRLLAL